MVMNLLPMFNLSVIDNNSPIRAIGVPIKVKKIVIKKRSYPSMSNSIPMLINSDNGRSKSKLSDNGKPTPAIFHPRLDGLSSGIG